MARNEIHTQDTVDTQDNYSNTTGFTAGTGRGFHAAELPINTAKSITPADDTDVDFTHRFMYVGGAGNVAVRFASGGTAYTFVGLPAGALIPLKVYSIDSTSTTATSILLLG